MWDLFFSDNAIWFGIPAIAGTLFFAFRLLLMMVTGGGDDFLHADGGSAFDLHADHDHSSGAFKVLSVQAISAFLMGFGWGGLGAYRGWGLPALLSVPVGFGVGVGMMWLLGKLLGWVARMQSSGTVPLAAALYEEGTVYVTIPARRVGRGTVRVVVSERMQYYTAVTEGDEIPSQSRVRVTGINDDNTLTVERVTDHLPPSGV